MSQGEATTVAVLGVPSPLANNTPVPQGWDLAVDEEGLVYYLHPETEVTSWTDPRFPMPAGCEERRADGGGAIFVRLEDKCVSFSLQKSLDFVEKKKKKIYISFLALWLKKMEMKLACSFRLALVSYAWV